MEKRIFKLRLGPGRWCPLEFSSLEEASRYFKQYSKNYKLIPPFGIDEFIQRISEEKVEEYDGKGNRTSL